MFQASSRTTGSAGSPAAALAASKTRMWLASGP